MSAPGPRRLPKLQRPAAVVAPVAAEPTTDDAAGQGTLPEASPRASAPSLKPMTRSARFPTAAPSSDAPATVTASLQRESIASFQAIWKLEAVEEQATRRAVLGPSAEGEMRDVDAADLTTSPYQPAARPAPDDIARAKGTIASAGGSIEALLRDEMTETIMAGLEKAHPGAHDLLALAIDISLHGIQQRVLVRAIDGRLEALSGHRRRAAAELAGRRVPIEVMHNVSESDAARLVARGNAWHKAMTPWQWASMMRSMRLVHPERTSGVAEKHIMQSLGRSKALVYEYLNIAEQLAADGWDDWVPTPLRTKPDTVNAALDRLGYRDLRSLREASTQQGVRARLAQTLCRWSSDDQGPSVHADARVPVVSQVRRRDGGFTLKVALDVDKTTDMDALASVEQALETYKAKVMARIDYLKKHRGAKRA